MDIQLRAKLAQITTFIFDVDGVMTDASVTAFDAVDLGRTYNVRDGFAMQMALKSGFEMAIITGGKQESIVKRLAKVGINHIFLGVPLADKLKIFDEFIASKGIKANEVLFMGDDLPDYGIMKHREVLAACPADAVPEITSVAQIITPQNGGKGAVREVIEMVFKAQNKWNFHLSL
jgi:3-deoxy-D-manno-octulosonate 8-phosphate phosphatase (KDO 8-P phosphatase)